MKKTKAAKIEELLDSDDEFPTDYYEEPTLPAYLNDYYFDMIDFKWITDPSLRESTTKSPATSPAKPKSNTTTIQVASKYMNKPIINRGVLKKHDLYCIKSIEGHGDSMLIWFINFLILKDVHSNYEFLKSCLVNKYFCDCNSNLEYKLL